MVVEEKRDILPDLIEQSPRVLLNFPSREEARGERMRSRSLAIATEYPIRRSMVAAMVLIVMAAVGAVSLSGFMEIARGSNVGTVSSSAPAKGPAWLK